VLATVNARAHSLGFGARGWHHGRLMWLRFDITFAACLSCYCHIIL